MCNETVGCEAFVLCPLSRTCFLKNASHDGVSRDSDRAKKGAISGEMICYRKKPFTFDGNLGSFFNICIFVYLSMTYKKFKFFKIISILYSFITYLTVILFQNFNVHLYQIIFLNCSCPLLTLYE